MSLRGDGERHCRFVVKTLLPGLFWWWGDGKMGHWIRAGIEASMQQSNSCAGRALALLGAPSASGLGVARESPSSASKSSDVCCHFQSLPFSPARFGRWQSILQRCEGRGHGDFCKWRWAGPHPVGPSHVPSHRPVSQTCATYPSAKAKC